MVSGNQRAFSRHGLMTMHTTRSSTCPTLGLLLSLIASSCSALRVHELVPGSNSTTKSTIERLEGLPFFRKVGALQQTTTRSRTYRSVTLTMHEDAHEVGPNGATATTSRIVDSLQVPVKESSWDEVVVKAVIDTMPLDPSKAPSLACVVALLVPQAKLEPISPAKMMELFDVERLASGGLAPGEHAHDQVLDNTVAEVAVVDYGTTYFVNAVTPLFGTASLGVKLAGDGTLNEVSAEVDATKLADQLPIKEFLSSKLLPAAAAAALDTNATRRVQYRLVVSAVPQGYRYVLTHTECISTDKDKDSSDRKRAPLTYANAQTITRKSLSDAGSTGPAAQPILAVSGTVSQLPQDKKP